MKHASNGEPEAASQGEIAILPEDPGILWRREEIDSFWEKLSSDPEAEQCGWLKDRYGVSRRVWPTALGEMMAEGAPEQVARVTKAFLAMKKYDIASLQRAYEGNG